MKTFEQLINEENNDVVGIINNLPKGAVLYRGFSGFKPTNLQKMKVPENRVPTDTPIQFHHRLDELFNKNFGIKARSDTLFCSKSFDMVERYAKDDDNIFIVVPINPSYIWSTKVVDLFDSIFDTPLDKVLNEFYPSFDKSLFSSSDLKSRYKTLSNEGTKLFNEISDNVLNNIVKTYKKSSNLSQVNNNEVMVYCSDYYVISYKDCKCTTYEQVQKYLEGLV